MNVEEELEKTQTNICQIKEKIKNEKEKLYNLYYKKVEKSIEERGHYGILLDIIEYIEKHNINDLEEYNKLYEMLYERITYKNKLHNIIVNNNRVKSFKKKEEPMLEKYYNTFENIFN